MCVNVALLCHSFLLLYLSIMTCLTISTFLYNNDLHLIIFYFVSQNYDFIS